MERDGVLDRIEVTPAIHLLVLGDGRVELSNQERVAGDDDEGFLAALDGLEALLLTLYAEGFDMTDPRMRAAVVSAVECIANNT